MELSVTEQVMLKFLLQDVMANLEFDECVNSYIVRDKEIIFVDKDDYERIKSLIDRL